MSRKENKPEPQELNLEDAIDALLAQVDTTCTEVENPRAAKAIPGALPPLQGTTEARASQDAATPEGSQEPEAPQADENEEPEDAQPEHASAEDQQRDALDALDQVQDMTQSLIEDSIDQLLSETQTQTDTDSSPDSPQDESAASETSTDVPAEEPVTDEADIDAQLDALDGPEATQPEQPADTQTDTQTDSQTDAQEAAPAESAAAEQASETEPEPLADSDDLLNAIADDLTNAAESPGAPDAAERSSKTQSETAAEDPTAAQSQSDETAEQITDMPTDETTAETTDESNDEGTNREPNPEASREASQEAGDPVAAQPEPSEQTSAAEADNQSEQDILSTLADLDQSLASGDALLMGDFETPDGDLISSESLQDVHDATALLEQLGLDTLDFETPPPEQADQETTFDAKASLDQAGTVPATQTGVPTQQHPAAGEPTPAGQQPSLRPKALEPVPLMLEPDAEVESIWQTARRVIVPRTQHALQLARTHAGPLGARAVLAINKPIKERPAQLRDSIGYLALWTLLLAVILWVYLAFIRTSPTPTPTQAPSRMLDAQDAGGRVDPLPESP